MIHNEGKFGINVDKANSNCLSNLSEHLPFNSCQVMYIKVDGLLNKDESS